MTFSQKVSFLRAFVWTSSLQRIWSEAHLPGNFRWLRSKPGKRDFPADLSSPRALSVLCFSMQWGPVATLHCWNWDVVQVEGSFSLWFALKWHIWLLPSWSINSFWHVVHRWAEALFFVDFFNCHSFARFNLICTRNVYTYHYKPQLYTHSSANNLGRGSKSSQCFRKSST